MPIVGLAEVAVVMAGLLILVVLPAVCGQIDDRRAPSATAVAPTEPPPAECPGVVGLDEQPPEDGSDPQLAGPPHGPV